MELEAIYKVIGDWQQKTHTVLDLKEISLESMEKLLCDTYILLTEYQNERLVPKVIIKLFSEMDDFLYFASLMEEIEVENDFYHYQEIYDVVEKLKDGFFDPEYDLDFPLLQVIE